MFVYINLTKQANLTVKFDAMTKEGERIYCLDGEFELKYPEGKSA